ncbi:MAG TPA: hypothetical protein VFZ08_09400 [Terriglobia bacterium]|nr:hypothetical protein [Terriglobia bacterium]
MARTSKKQMILEIYAARNFHSAGRAELQSIKEDLLQRLGEKGAAGIPYIARVLRRADVPVQYDDPFAGPAMPEPYAGRLQGALRFHDLASAEASLRNLDAAYRDYREAGDRTGVALVRLILIKGKLRAERLAGNPRIQPEKRTEKQEIANWFRVWLQTPEIFFDWLEIRKRSEEFEREFGTPN